MSSFKPYPAYKASGIDWLGEIPEHWRTTKGKWEWEKQSRPIRETDEIVTAFRDGQVTLRKNRREDGFTIAALEHGYQGIRKGDLVIHGMDAFAGAIGVSDSDGKSSPVYSACTPRRESNPYYFAYLLKEMSGKGWIEALAKGIRERSTEFKFPQFSELLYPIPPKTEQTAIVRFLDHKIAEIKEFIALKEKTIALLKERKAAIINKAVTKGLDPKAAMKNSGVEWLGEIPAHWEVSSIKRLAAIGRKTFTDGDWIESPNITDSGVRLIQTGNVGQGLYKEKGYRYISEKTFRSLNCTELYPEDVLICRLDGPVGRACEVPDLGVRMITSVDNAILKVGKAAFSKYIVFTMTSSLWLNWIQSLCRAGGGFRFRISRRNLGDLSFPLPQLSEQKRIVSYLQIKIMELDQSITQAEEEITLIKEYQQSLISEAVTGKIDVREWEKGINTYSEREEEALLLAAEPENTYNQKP